MIELISKYAVLINFLLEISCMIKIIETFMEKKRNNNVQYAIIIIILGLSVYINFYQGNKKFQILYYVGLFFIFKLRYEMSYIKTIIGTLISFMMVGALELIICIPYNLAFYFLRTKNDYSILITLTVFGVCCWINKNRNIIVSRQLVDSYKEKINVKYLIVFIVLFFFFVMAVIRFKKELSWGEGIYLPILFLVYLISAYKISIYQAEINCHKQYGEQYGNVVMELRDTLECPLSVDNLADIYHFLDQDFYFSPSFSENSFDLVLLCYAIAIIDDKSGFGLAILNRIFKEACPEISSVDFSNVDVDLELLLQTEVQFYAALAICSIHYSTLIALLPKFAAAYMEDLHFTCEDFILYDFMDEYFETKNCSANPAFQEMTDTLVLATLQSFDTDLENFTLDGLFQLKHPAGRFAAIYRSGAIDMKDLPVPADAAVLMKHILSYAAAYELRNNLYDYHLDEDKTITLTNWKENLKWHYVQYTNVYNLALSSFVAACYSRKLLQKQFEENLRELN